MRDLFHPLQRRFHASRPLERIGRELYLGFAGTQKNLVPPFTLVDGRMKRSLDTFSQDIEQWQIEFRFRGKSILPIDGGADEWMRAMTDAYHTKSWGSYPYSIIQLRMTDTDGPFEDRSAFDARATFEVVCVRVVRLPLNTGV